MNLSFFLFAILLIIFPNTIKTATITCRKNTQCPNTHYCNLKHRLCILKQSVNGTCSSNQECLSDKCYGSICRQGCNSDNNCSLTKEYCTQNKYCARKHCKFCWRNAECANNYCRSNVCEKTNCSTVLNNLFKQ